MKPCGVVEKMARAYCNCNLANCTADNCWRGELEAMERIARVLIGDMREWNTARRLAGLVSENQYRDFEKDIDAYTRENNLD